MSKSQSMRASGISMLTMPEAKEFTILGTLAFVA